MAAQNVTKGGLASLGLQCRLLEVAVVVGMDEETGLHARRNTDPSNSSLFDCDFQGHLRDILSGPQDCTVSGSEIISSPLKTLRNSLKHKNQSSPAKSRPLQRSMSVRKLRKNANKREDVPVSVDFLSNMPCLCLPEESKVYNSPPESKIHCTVLTDIDGCRHYAVILTVYRHFFATHLEASSWTLSAKIKSPTRATVNGNMGSEPISCYVPWCVCFVSMKPYFSILKDALSCFHKEYMMSSSGSWRKILEKYVTNLSLVVCPPPLIEVRFSLGSMPVVLSPPLYPSKQDYIIDIDLRLPLFIFMREPTVLLKVLACIMHEQRIVFFSSNYTLLPLIMECFRCYISPMEWHHQYIPILFSEIIGFVDCPGIFMMGCHSRHKAEIEKVENDLFLVDLDQATINTNSHSTAETDGGVLGQFALHMPVFAVENLLKRLSDFELHNSISSVCRVNPVTLEEMRTHNLKIRQSVNRKIQNVFMEFMINIFGSTLSFLDHERHEFKADKFLESINPTDSPFYIKVSKSYMFRRFVRHRLAGVNDDFKKAVEKRMERKLLAMNSRTRLQSSESSISQDSISDSGSMERRCGFRDKGSYRTQVDRRLSTDQVSLQEKIIPENGDFFSGDVLFSDHFDSDHDATVKPTMFNGVTSSDEISDVTVTLPAFPVPGTNFNAKHFYRRCIAAMTESMDKVTADLKTSPHRSCHRAALLLMRGLYELAEESLVKGLQDLHATAKEDARFFPEKLIKKVISSLNQRELDLIQQHSLYKNLPPKCKTIASRTQSTVAHQMRSFFSDDNTALYSLKKEPFTFAIEKADVTTDEKAISNLFHALCTCSDPKSNEIDPECFNAFYQTWLQLKNDCKKALKSLCSDVRLLPELSEKKSSNAVGTEQFLTFQSDESILKISGTVLSNKGNGRLLLTTKRIIFVSAGNRECKAIIKLGDLLSITEGRLKNFLTSMVALHVHYQNTQANPNTRLRIGLKSDTALWIHLINEIKFGASMSREQRDDDLSFAIAAQNVCLADAFFSAVCDEEYMKQEDAMVWVAKLCKFESLKDSGESTTFTPETRDMMAMRMDPSPKESKKSGVCSMTYSSAEIDEIPHIWMILTSGKLRLIDTTTWQLDPIPVKEWDTKPNCICLMQDKKLWIGGEDGNVYVLSLTTKHVTRILHDHTSAIVAVITLPNDSVGSATRSGEVIIWEPEPTKVLRKFNAFEEPVNLVGFMPVNDKLCCCSTIHIAIRDYDGNLLQRLEPGDSPRVMNSNLTCCTWDTGNEVWAGDDRGTIYVWDLLIAQPDAHSASGPKDMPLTQPKLAGAVSEDDTITCMLKNNGKLWVGNSSGAVIIFNTVEPGQECTLKAHDGPITSLCRLENRYVISGSGDDDGKLVLWTQSKGAS